MKIAMIGARSVPAAYGGVEKAVEELSVRLVERGHEVTVFCSAGDTDRQPGTTSTYRGIQLVSVKALSGKYTRAISQSVQASRIALVRDFDIVHYHAMGPSLTAPIVRLRPGKRVVATLHGRDDQRAKWGPLARRVLRLGARSAMVFSQATVAVSRSLQADLRDEFGRASSVITNGIDHPSRTAGTSALDAIGVVPHRYLLNVGRLVPEKGVDLLVDAFAALDTDQHLVIVGGASGTEEWVAEVKRRASSDSRVHFVGERRGDDLHQLFTHASGFVFPSRLEGLPIVLLEAVSYGLPLVCSDIDPDMEVVSGSTGPGVRVFPRDDTAGLTAAIADLLADLDNGSAAPGVRALLHDVEDRFSWDRAVDLYEALYTELTTAPKRRPLIGRAL